MAIMITGQCLWKTSFDRRNIGSLVENGIVAAPEKAVLIEAQRKLMEDQKLKDLKVKNYLFQAIDRKIIETILVKDIGKQIWDLMKQKYQGSIRVKRAQLQALRRELEVLQIKEGEGMDEYSARTHTIANKIKIHGEKMDQVVIIEKILRSMTLKFDYIMCLVEESNDLDTLAIDKLQSSLLVYGERMNGHRSGEKRVLKVSYEDRVGGRGRDVELTEEEAEAEEDNLSTKKLWNVTSATN
ncbi:uncharacterized protein LOC111412639 [Olea europaea var. sylvestris]|uniref:uncharacterized protein LOC111412639 n=1 Tax=Olea europaea var. sylvestris TaxID=158386 RepID=UPI000C1D2A87|nr:uncharacterized protein LOC111412639 [Olea europaea var. sylvestris]